jgi:CheY-like chemotaxis protein
MNRGARERAQPTNAHGRKALRVLCAEDDDPIAFLVKSVLEREGHHVERVADGEEALERITADVKFFHLLITDHQMPRRSGLALVSKLRDTAFSGTIVVHSSRLRDAEVEAYRALAVDHILSKPVQLDALLAIVRQVIESTP